MESKKVGDVMVVGKGLFPPGQSLYTAELQDCGAANRLMRLLSNFPENSFSCTPTLLVPKYIDTKDRTVASEE